MHRLIAYVSPTIDTIAEVDTAYKQELWRSFDATSQDVLLLPDAKDVQALGRRLSPAARQAPGGNALNATVALADEWAQRGFDGAITAKMPTDFGYDPCFLSPSDVLRRVGVSIDAIHNDVGARRSLCLISDKGEKLGIVATQPRLNDGKRSFDAADVTLISSGDLVGIAGPWRGAGALAVIVSDIASAAQLSSALTKNSDATGYVLCDVEEFLAFAGPDALGGRDIAPGFEIVITDGARPARVRPAFGTDIATHALPAAAAVMVNRLGAGDSFAGGYIGARLAGAMIEDAIQAGHKQALRTLASPHANAAPCEDLNALFGARTDRSSPLHDEAASFTTLRRSAGLVVISCGQSGIDQIGLLAAQAFGLITFAIMPKHRRTEFTEGKEPAADFFGNAIHIELGSESYRYCTWTNAYLSDGTIIFDRARSEGSEETRKACRALGRPFLDIADLPSSAVPGAVAAWTAKHDVRILNIAGNRPRLIDEQSLDEARGKLRVAIRWACWTREQLRQGRDIAAIVGERHAQAPPKSFGGLKIAAPKQSPIRQLLDAFLSEVYGAPIVSHRKLFVHYPDLDLSITYLKSYDIPPLVADGHVELGFAVSDMLHEHGDGGFDIHYATGAHPCSLVQLAKPGHAWPPRHAVSQYPGAAKRYLGSIGCGETPVRTVHGGAEAFLHLTPFDCVIDTWQTGVSAEENGLQPVETLAPVSLAAFTRRQTSEDARARAFSDAFRAWALSARY